MERIQNDLEAPHGPSLFTEARDQSTRTKSGYDLAKRIAANEQYWRYRAAYHGACHEKYNKVITTRCSVHQRDRASV